MGVYTTMIPQEPSPIMRRLIALYQATQLAHGTAQFHAEMQQHAQELEKALIPTPTKADLPPLEPAT